MHDSPQEIKDIHRYQGSALYGFAKAAASPLQHVRTDANEYHMLEQTPWRARREDRGRRARRTRQGRRHRKAAEGLVREVSKTGERHGFAGALRTLGGVGAMSGPPPSAGNSARVACAVEVVGVVELQHEVA